MSTNHDNWGRGHTLPMGTTPNVSQLPDSPIPGLHTSRPYDGSSGSSGGSGRTLLILFGPASVLLIIRACVGSIGDWYAALTGFAIAAPIGLAIALVLYGRSIWSHRWSTLKALGAITRTILGVLTWVYVTVAVFSACMAMAGATLPSIPQVVAISQIASAWGFISPVLVKGVLPVFVLGVLRFMLVLSR
jgi:hypothetical protein